MLAGRITFLKSGKMQMWTSELGEDQLLELARRMESVEYTEGDYLVKMGEPADTIYFIVQGECSVHMDGPELVRLRDSDLFGESCLAPDQADAKRKAHVVACSAKCSCLRLSAKTFHELLGHMQDVLLGGDGDADERASVCSDATVSTRKVAPGKPAKPEKPLTMDELFARADEIQARLQMSTTDLLELGNKVCVWWRLGCLSNGCVARWSWGQRRVGSQLEREVEACDAAAQLLAHPAGKLGVVALHASTRLSVSWRAPAMAGG